METHTQEEATSELEVGLTFDGSVEELLAVAALRIRATGEDMRSNWKQSKS